MNRVILMGRLGADAELRMTAGGASLLKLSLATSEKYKDNSGELVEKTQWHRCTLWGDRAAKLAPHLIKGSQILVDGSIEYGSYEKDGEKRYTTDIKIFNLEFAGGGKKKGDDFAGGDGGDDEPIPF